MDLLYYVITRRGIDRLVLKQNPKLKKIEDIYPVKSRHGFVFGRNKRTEKLINSYFRLPPKQASDGVYSPKRDNFKLYQKTKKPLLEINVIWQKLKTFLRKYDSILRRKVALRPRRFTRSGYTVKDRSRPPRVESRLPRVEVGTSIGIKSGLKSRLNLESGNLFRKVYFKKIAALITILAVLVTAYFQNSQTGQAATNGG